MSHYFISDLHLEESRPDITRAFLLLLNTLQGNATSLYILGDFFESWIGDDENTELQVTIKQQLKSLSESGTTLYFMHGNRDFLIGDIFAEETGATLLPDPCVIELAQQKMLLMHGDSLCTEDAGYMKFRATIRNPAFLEPFLKRPIEERKITAQQLRAMSQANNQNKSMDIMDVTLQEVPRVMDSHGISILIHGHTHRPKIHSVQLENTIGERIVLGDWDQNVWYLKIDESGNKVLNHYPLCEDIIEL